MNNLFSYSSIFYAQVVRSRGLVGFRLILGGKNVIAIYFLLISDQVLNVC